MDLLHLLILSTNVPLFNVVSAVQYDVMSQVFIWLAISCVMFSYSSVYIHAPSDVFMQSDNVTTHECYSAFEWQIGT